MKQIFSFLLINLFAFFALSQNCLALNQFSATISKMESSLLGITYEKQTDSQRLSRLEESVYGSASANKSLQERLSKLSKDLQTDQLGKEIKPKRDTFEDSENTTSDTTQKSDSNVRYPMVDLLEQTAFNKSFPTTDINKRLDNLEQNVFKKTYNDDLNNRVDRLKAVLKPQTVASHDDDESYNNNDDDNSDDSSNQNYFTPANTPNSNSMSESSNDNDNDNDMSSQNSDITSYLSSLEKKILHKTFNSDATQTRLVRLETKVFKSTFTQDDTQTRLDRIASAYQAQKSAKRYDNNKFQQNMATAMQVGAFLLMILA